MIGAIIEKLRFLEKKSEDENVCRKTLLDHLVALNNSIDEICSSFDVLPPVDKSKKDLVQQVDNAASKALSPVINICNPLKTPADSHSPTAVGSMRCKRPAPVDELLEIDKVEWPFQEMIIVENPETSPVRKVQKVDGGSKTFVSAFG